jgi:hypothetical protein
MLVILGHVVRFDRQLPAVRMPLISASRPTACSTLGAVPPPISSVGRNAGSCAALSAKPCAEARGRPAEASSRARARRRRPRASGLLLLEIACSPRLCRARRRGNWDPWRGARICRDDQLLLQCPIGRAARENTWAPPAPAWRDRRDRRRRRASCRRGFQVREMHRVFAVRQPERVDDRRIAVADLRIVVARRDRSASGRAALNISPKLGGGLNPSGPAGVNGAELGPALDDVGERSGLSRA